MRSRLVKSLCVGVHQTVEKEEVSAGRHLHQDQDNDQNDWMDYAVVCRYANPNRVFEPTIIWGKGNLGALGSAGKWIFHLGPEKGAIWSISGHQRDKSMASKCRLFYPDQFINGPAMTCFFATNPFSLGDEFVFTEQWGRSCHFDVTACAEARRLALQALRAG